MTHEFYWSCENALHERFYRWAVAWSLNGNVSAHRSALKKHLAFEYYSSSLKQESYKGIKLLIDLLALYRSDPNGRSIHQESSTFSHDCNKDTRLRDDFECYTVYY